MWCCGDGVAAVTVVAVVGWRRLRWSGRSSTAAVTMAAVVTGVAATAAHGARGGEGCARDKEAAYSPIASPGEEWFSLHLQMWAPRRASVPRRTRAGCGLCNGTAVHYHLCPCVHRAAPASGAVCDAASARFYAPHLPAPLRRRMHSPLAFCIASCLLRIAHDVIASHQANLQRL